MSKHTVCLKCSYLEIAFSEWYHGYSSSAPQDQLASWRRTGYLADLWPTHSQNPKMSLSWPSRWRYTKRFCFKWVDFLGILRTPINSNFNWLISVTFASRKNPNKISAVRQTAISQGMYKMGSDQCPSGDHPVRGPSGLWVQDWRAGIYPLSF